MGIDVIIERRRGEHIAAKRIYHDAVRSSHTHLVKVHGLRWVSLMVLTRIPGATRVWALPFLTVLPPSEWYDQLHSLARRWLPTRELVVVGDQMYAVLEWLDTVRHAVCVQSPACDSRRRSMSLLHRTCLDRTDDPGRRRAIGCRLRSRS
jgi:hypothetical protein